MVAMTKTFFFVVLLTAVTAGGSLAADLSSGEKKDPSPTVIKPKPQDQKPPHAHPVSAEKSSESVSHAPGRLLSELFAKWGPLAVFFLMLASGIGLHFPEDLVVIPAGWEIATGNFPLVGTFLAAYLGVAGGDAGWFLLCRFCGSKLLGTRWFLKTAHPRRILEIKHLIDRYGALVLVISRLVPGARTPSLAVAGLMHLKYRTFFAVEMPMAVLSVSLQLGIGYYAAKGLLQGSTSWHKASIVVGIVLLAALGIGTLIVRRQLAKGKLRLPRAKAVWLREVRGGSRAVLRQTPKASAGG